MLRSLFVLLFLVTAAASLACWVVSPAMAVNWAVDRDGTPEAVLDARVLLWLGRLAAPMAAIACWRGLRRWKRTSDALRRLGSELLEVTRRPCGTTVAGRAGTVLIRGTIVGWLLLAVVHWGAAGRRVVHEWPIYQFRSGAQVLPNMSESNRDVIRYVESATPEDARILAVSDQTLFFLSYYLWPREILQRRHPESEFTVPQPGRQLAAYRLSDLSDDEIAACEADYVLEYFEGPDYVERDRLLEDARWIDACRYLHGNASYVPPFNVRLRPIEEVQGQR